MELGAKVRALVHYNAIGTWGWLDTIPRAALDARRMCRMAVGPPAAHGARSPDERLRCSSCLLAILRAVHEVFAHEPLRRLLEGRP